ncbi:MAG: 50S ribosomal protein L2 [Euryarchaeota archaeon RBG_16_68_13]|nr:MAG: 50S ribosomal protein L2 [Euryarchaeota archaeon RBG_16_68_13]
MGKNLRTQRRGRGKSPTYRSPSHRHPGPVTHPYLGGAGIVTDIFQAPGHTAPLARVRYDTAEVLMIACDGLQVGQRVTIGVPNIDRGNTLPLGEIPEGTLVYNLEAAPGDGGRFVRAAGVTAVVVSRGPQVVVQMPSGQFRSFHPRCQATIGAVAGAGRGDKPFTKAGKKFHAFRSLSKAYFRVRGVAMNAVNHPHGGGSHQHVGKPSTVGYDAPPGRKVGRLSPKPKRMREKRRRR